MSRGIEAGEILLYSHGDPYTWENQWRFLSWPTISIRERCNYIRLHMTWSMVASYIRECFEHDEYFYWEEVWCDIETICNLLTDIPDEPCTGGDLLC